jgi:hypothetical protein
MGKRKVTILEPAVEKSIPIAEQHKKLVRRRIKYYKQHSKELIDWETARKKLKID